MLSKRLKRFDDARRKFRDKLERSVLADPNISLDLSQKVFTHLWIKIDLYLDTGLE